MGELILDSDGITYVPKSYRFEDDGTPTTPHYYEDVCAFLPEIDFDSNYKKWYIKFKSADLGGYDVQEFIYYYDSLKELLIALGVPLEEI